MPTHLDLEPEMDKGINSEKEAQQEESPLLDLIFTNYDDILTAEACWQRLNERIAYWTSEAHLRNVLEITDEEFANSDRRDLQRAVEKMLSTVQRNVNASLAHAKYEAQLLCAGGEVHAQAAQERLDECMSLLEDEEDPYRIHFLELHLEATRLFLEAYDADKSLTEPIYELISQDAILIEDLLEFFESEETDLEDYEGLLYALARNHFDPMDTALVPAAVEALKNTPELYQIHHTHTQTEVKDDPETETQRLLILLGEFAVYAGLDKNTVPKFVEDVNFTQLPLAVQEEIKEANTAHLKDVANKFIAILKPYDQPKRYMLRTPPSITSSDAPKAKKRTASRTAKRVTAKSSTNIQFGTEENLRKRKITGVCFAKQTPEGYVFDEVIAERNENTGLPDESWRHEAAEAILQTRTFANYTDKYRNREDVYAMLCSVLANPIGNGVSSMNDQKIALITPGGSTAKKKRVLHFSAKDSTGLDFTQSAESNRTRIFFTTSGKQLIILDIQHKTTAERQRGSFLK